MTEHYQVESDVKFYSGKKLAPPRRKVSYEPILATWATSSTHI